MKTVLLAALLAVPSFADEPTKAAPSGLPAVQESQLKSGVKLALLEMRRVPVVTMQIVLPYAGGAYDPEGREGLSSLMASLIEEGAGSMQKSRFNQKVEELGGNLKVSVGADSLTVTLFAAKEDAGKLFALAASAIRRANVSEADFEAARRDELSGLAQLKGDASALAKQRFNERVFAGHPYGRSETEASVRSLTLRDAREFSSRLRPEGAIVTATGDMDMRALERMARKGFGDWRSAKTDALPAAHAAVAALAPGPLVIDLIDMPGAGQSTIRLGFDAPKKGAPDTAAFFVMNYILGQADVASRLNQNLRERHGWAYGAGSGIGALKDGGSFAASASVEADATAPAIQEIGKELRRLRDEPVPQEELDRDKKMLLFAMMQGQQKVQTINPLLSDLELYGLPKDRLSTNEARIRAVTAADVQAAAQAHLRLDALQVVVAGDAARVKASLEALGTVRVIDANGHPIAAPVSAPGAGR